MHVFEKVQNSFNPETLHGRLGHSGTRTAVVLQYCVRRMSITVKTKSQICRPKRYGGFDHAILSSVPPQTVRASAQPMALLRYLKSDLPALVLKAIGCLAL